MRFSTKTLRKKLPALALLTMLLMPFWASSVYADGLMAAGTTVTDQQVKSQLKKNPIVTDLNQIVNFLSAGVGIIVVIVLIIGGIQYSLAGDNAQAVAAARARIMNGLIALAVFLFMWAFLQWLIPGGVFS